MTKEEIEQKVSELLREIGLHGCSGDVEVAVEKISALVAQAYEEAARVSCEYCAKNRKPDKWPNGIWYHSDVAFMQLNPDEPINGGQQCLAQGIRDLKASLTDSKGSNG